MARLGEVVVVALGGAVASYRQVTGKLPASYRQVKNARKRTENARVCLLMASYRQIKIIQRKENNMCILEKQKSELRENVKESYVARYKCRNCGRIYENKNVTLNNWIMPEAPKYHPHFCEHNVYGIGDLILVRKIGDVSGGWERDFGNIELEVNLIFRKERMERWVID